MADALIDIEVVHAGLQRQVLLSAQVPAGSTVYQALLASGIGQSFPDLDLATCPVGIFGKLVSDPQMRIVQAGERIEIYRALLADPKEIRRLRAARTARVLKKARP
ncbi:RnfH family protein [Pseudomonas sp. 3A(2025)]